MKKVFAALLIFTLFIGLTGNKASATIDEMPKIMSLPKSVHLLK